MCEVQLFIKNLNLSKRKALYLSMPNAIQMVRYGDPDVLEWRDTDLPALQPTEVRVKTIAAAVNRADLEIRQGNWQITATHPFPYTPGLEVVGTVQEVGHQVSCVKIGDRVITMMQQLGGIHGTRPGGYQEFVTVEENSVALIPPELNPLEVAALGLAAVTAYNGIQRLNLKPGHRVVIHGATGGVGSAAVAIAKALGAQVLATTSSLTKADYLVSLGADQVILLGDRPLLDSIPARSVDAVFESIGQATFADSVAVLKRGGHLCLVGAASGEHLCFTAWDLLQDLHLTGYSSENLTGAALKSDMQQLYQWLVSGQIVAPDYQTFPLSEAASVHLQMENRTLTGRSLLVP